MKVSFSTIDPKDFNDAVYHKINRRTATFKPKQRNLNKEKAKLLLAPEIALRQEQLKNRLLEVPCGNTSCKNILEYVYDDRKSEYWAKIQAKWANFKSIKCWLCPTCAHIQKNRLKIK